MASRPDPRCPASILVIIAAVLVAGCGLEGTTRTGGGDPSRFHGAEGIEIPPGPSEPSWWIDPVIEDGDDGEAPPDDGPVTIHATVPADTLFEIGSSEITPAAEAALDAVHASLNGDVVLAVTLDCHADSTGDAGSNQTLSEDRAASLSAWTTTRWDLSAEQITGRGHGDTQPIASNETPTGRSHNRRCEISLTVERTT